MIMTTNISLSTLYVKCFYQKLEIDNSKKTEP